MENINELSVLTPQGKQDIRRMLGIDDDGGGCKSSLKYIIDGSNKSIIEGNIENNISSGIYSHSEGDHTTASGVASHAEGYETSAGDVASHAEGHATNASVYSHAEGDRTTASGVASHAEGVNTLASGNQSHAEGYYTIAKNSTQHVFGAFNIQDPSSANIGTHGTYIEIVGNGTASMYRSNARTLDWDGNERLKGSLTLGAGLSDEVTITAAQLKQLLALLN